MKLILNGLPLNVCVNKWDEVLQLAQLKTAT